ncbi:MAG: hypothetical protein A2939_00255 [Parcubacteria group bacterium RIFCSPLOWO2_01_FULL_48_18]|nr:MAG: hypothetical protein A2939_00255 [Parcubacteria group bacterium RIFCSPLOWO2_01_FULL_48_18]
MRKIKAKLKKIYKSGGVGGLLKRAKGAARRKMTPLEPLALPHALSKIKKLGPGLSVDELIDFVFNKIWGIIKPTQLVQEITGLMEIVKAKSPKIILEIGTDRGGTLFLFSRIIPDSATIISIDLLSKDGGYPDWRKKLYNTFKLPGQSLHLIKGNSHDPQTLKKVKDVLGDQKIDFMFIDGDHKYEGVKKDFEIYRDLVKEGGLIAFHDITVQPFDKNCTVNIFWDEIKKNYNHRELVQNPDRLLYGIGVIEYK